MSPPRGELKNSIKASITLVIVIHLGVPWCDVAFCLLGCCIICSAIMLPDRVPEIKVLKEKNNKARSP